jgi:hypothetical protein
MKRCSKCKIEKDETCFHREKSSKDGLRYNCKTCDWNRKKIQQQTPAGRKKHAEAQRKSNLKTRYGLTFEAYNKMFESQNGVCAICGKPEHTKLLSVDHSHKTRKVRGLLCTGCNLVLGKTNDDSNLLMMFIQYLRTHE